MCFVLTCMVAETLIKWQFEIMLSFRTIKLLKKWQDGNDNVNFWAVVSREPSAHQPEKAFLWWHFFFQIAMPKFSVAGKKWLTWSVIEDLIFDIFCPIWLNQLNDRINFYNRFWRNWYLINNVEWIFWNVMQLIFLQFYLSFIKWCLSFDLQPRASVI